MTRKKLEGNGMWESSRMMLPEHKAAINERERELRRRKRIELDESEWERISAMMAESLERRKPITLRLYDPYEARAAEGVVERIDVPGGRVRLDGVWVRVKDVESAALAD
ncbi:YolD-like family protein [Paenibacillus protaetiae]|uniref:YolD-like family protein n=1 Tax=Paenibacillus protaetiae TaxID=2509456 RepID=A0A4P6ER36_9BACL|nr:YolD-like family protein [Paenibacillus protaetiae]QAY65460.1 YolD-like family protein [Paenibacillus protaetiae]